MTDRILFLTTVQSTKSLLYQLNNGSSINFNTICDTPPIFFYKTLVIRRMTSSNHHSSIVTFGSEGLRHLVESFPVSSYVFAYGSAVFLQKGQPKGKLIDLVFIVDDPLAWHAENLQRNPSHYSVLRHLGPKLISYIQENLGCGIYYNTFASVDNRLLKYGVISTESVIDDLENWRFIYIAGRLHKPVRELTSLANVELIKCLEMNRKSAIRGALLQLPQTFTKFDLYYSITELSYIGDSRMMLGEHPNKVQNIVESNLSGFDSLYLPLVKAMDPLVQISTDDLITQDISSSARRHHLLLLPSNLQYYLAQRVRGGYGLFPNPLIEDELLTSMTTLSTQSNLNIILRDALGSLIWISSLRQTATGFLSTGVFGSLKYALEKLKKAFFSD